MTRWLPTANSISNNTILARYKAYFDEMKGCGADQREIARWSHGTDLGGRELNFDNELEYLRDWWTRHIAYLDENVFIPYPEGDLNYDRNVNVSDVVVLINHLLKSGSETGNYLPRNDINQDGIVNIRDVSMLINRLLSID